MTLVPPQPASRRLDLLLCGVLALLCIVVFHYVLVCKFIPFDDDIEITTNPHIQALTAANFHWMFTNTSLTQRYTPFAWVVWALIYRFFKLNPIVYHGFALALHIANTLLAFVIFRKVLRRALPALTRPDRLAWASALGAALWALHPLRVEVLGWSTQVRFAEATVFALLSLLAYLRAAEVAPVAIYRSRFFWLSIAAYTTSIFFYPNAIGLAPLLPLLDLYFLDRPHPAGELRALLRFSLEKIPFLLPGIFIGILAIHGRLTHSTIFAAAVTLEQFDIAHRVMQAAYIFIYYLWKPFDILHISAVYTQLFNFSPFTPIFILSFAALVILTILAIANRRKHPFLFLLWAAHLLLLLPMGGYFEHPHYPSDRYSYLQGMLLPLLLAALALVIVHRARASMRLMVPVVAGVILLICSIFSALYTHPWKNGETFFLSILASLGNDPYRFDIETHLGKYYAEEGAFPQAFFYLDDVIHNAPTLPVPVYLKGMTLLRLAELNDASHQPPSTVQSLYHEAEAYLDRAAAMNSTAAYLTSAGDAYFEAKDYPAARARYEDALSLDPTHPDLPAKIARCSAPHP